MPDERPEAGAPVGGKDEQTAGAVTRGAGVALWRQVAEVIRQDITDRDPTQGDRLPTEQALAQRFGVNRHTIRQALSALRDQGIIRIEQGRGTFVVRDLIDYPLTTRTRFREILGRQRLASSARMLKWSRSKADERVLAALDLPPGVDVIVMEAAREVEGVRLSISTHICPADRFAHVPDHFAKTGSITEALQRCGVEDYHRRSTRISARLPSAEDARYLHQPRNRPILVTESVNVDPNGVPIELGITRFAGDRIQMLVDFDDRLEA